MDLKTYMEKNKLTASALAEKASIPVQCITRFIRGERGLSLDSALKINAATNNQVKIIELSKSEAA